jgi:hypothetical protein
MYCLGRHSSSCLAEKKFRAQPLPLPLSRKTRRAPPLLSIENHPRLPRL